MPFYDIAVLLLYILNVQLFDSQINRSFPESFDTHRQAPDIGKMKFQMAGSRTFLPTTDVVSTASIL